VAWITTIGRSTGLDRSVAVGFVDEPDGSILVAANSPDQAWARNLEADPRVIVEIGERRFTARAEPLERDDHIRTIRELILRYGTPSEGLGSGPSFRLRPVATEEGAG
jgi:deazaflavin-dependent oxidoreductase (nitroreductase family)